MSELVARPIVAGILRGLKEAQQTYEDWSRGSLGDYGLESVVTATVAGRVVRAMRKSARDGFVTLEEPLARIARAAGAAPRQGGRFPAALQGNPRIDMALWRGQGTVWGVIDVNRDLEWASFAAGWERLRMLLDRYGPARGGTLKFAGLAVPFSCADDGDCRRIRERYREVREYLAESNERAVVHEVEPYRFAPRRDREAHASNSHGGVFVEYQPHF